MELITTTDFNALCKETARIYNKALFDYVRRSAYPILDMDLAEEFYFVAEDISKAYYNDKVTSAEEYLNTYDDMFDWIFDTFCDYYDLSPKDVNDEDEDDYLFTVDGWFDAVKYALIMAYDHFSYNLYGKKVMPELTEPELTEEDAIMEMYRLAGDKFIESATATAESMLFEMMYSDLNDIGLPIERVKAKYEDVQNFVNNMLDEFIDNLSSNALHLMSFLRYEICLEEKEYLKEFFINTNYYNEAYENALSKVTK